MIKLLILLTFFAKDTSVFSDSSELEKIQLISIRADKNYPVTQKNISLKDIQKSYQGQEIPILLSLYPSVNSQSDGGHPQGYTYFRIRGIDQTRINMTLNGVPLNEPEDQGVYTSNYPGFTNSIKSIQIQRGVGTSTNGSASYGGSISFQSLNGLEKYNEGTFGYGSFNTKRINISNSSGLLKNGFSIFSNVSYFSSNGYKYKSGGEGYSIFISGGYYSEKQILKFTTFSGRSINQMAWLGVIEDSIKKDRRINANTIDTSDKFTQSLLQLQYTNQINKYSKISTTVFYNRLDGKYDYFLSGKRTVGLGSNFYGILSTYSLQKNSYKFIFGANFNKYDRTHQSYDNQNFVPVYKNTGYKNDISIFYKMTYNVKKISLFSDVQYRYVTFKYKGDKNMNPFIWNFVNPKLGISWNKKDNINYYLSVGYTKREPTRTGLFGGDDNLVSIVNINPENVTDFEFGLNKKYKNLELNGNIYHMRFKNEILPIGPLGSNSLPLMINVSKSYRSGVELDILKKYKYEGINILYNTNVSISYNKVINDSTFKPLYSPSIILNKSVDFEIGDVNIIFKTKYQSKSYIDFTNKYTIPSFLTFDVGFRYTYKNLSILFDYNNIFRKKYYTSGYVVDGKRFLFVNPLDSYYFTIKLKF